MSKLVQLAAALLLAGASQAALANSTLFIGTDADTFDGILPDQLGVAQVNGANFVSQNIYPTSVHINGLTDVSGHSFLYAGDPFGGVINKISYTGALLGSISVPGIATTCCNEDMIWTGSELYHGQYSNGIQLIDVTTGAVISTQPQPDVVGMSYVGGQIWITHWAGREVGIWDPTTNSFTPEFSTPSNAGGLAYDPSSGIMWVGLQGGSVVPYTLAGSQLNPGFQPFGTISDTIDGIAVLGEARPVPEPASLGLLGLAMAGLGWMRRRR